MPPKKTARKPAKKKQKSAPKRVRSKSAKPDKRKKAQGRPRLGITPEKERAYKMHLRGETHEQISQKMGKARQTITDWIGDVRETIADSPEFAQAEKDLLDLMPMAIESLKHHLKNKMSANNAQVAIRVLESIGILRSKLEVDHRFPDMDDDQLVGVLSDAVNSGQ